MPTHELRLSTDRFAAAESCALPAGNRVLYVVEGSLIVRSSGNAASLDPNSTWCGSGSAGLVAGKSGARVLRFELVDAGAAPVVRTCVVSSLTLAAPVTLPASEVLLRCDRVDFPPGGEALTHVHQGPGIRCLLQGAIRIDAVGESHPYKPGEAWFESGPDPVYAAASPDGPSAFVRVMVLPRTCHGKSSIRYVRPEDADRPKTQKYQIFADEFITP